MQPNPPMPVAFPVFQGPENFVYFNGFALSIGPADVTINLVRGQRQEAVICASHSTIKTLIEILGRSLKDFEEKTGATVKNLDEIDKALKIPQR